MHCFEHDVGNLALTGVGVGGGVVSVLVLRSAGE